MVTFVSHFYLLFKQFLKGIKDLRCRMVTRFYIISTFFFEHFLQGIIGLRCRMVTFSLSHLYLLFQALSARNYRPQV